MTAPAPVTAPMDDAGRAARGTVVLGGLQIAGRVLGLLFIVLVTRAVVPAQFGRYSIVAGLVVFAGFVADFGSTTVITRTVSQDPSTSDDLLAETLVASVLVGAVAYALIVAYLAVGPYDASLVRLGLIGGLAIPADAALTSTLAALDGHGLIARRGLVTFVRLALVAGGGAIAVVATGEIGGAVAMLAVGPIVACGLAFWMTRRSRVWSLALRPHWGRSVALFRSAVPYALLGGIGAMVARLDLLMLSWLSSTAEVARYDLPLRAVEAAASFGLVVGAPALFILSRRIGQGDLDGARRAFTHAADVAYVIGIPMSAILVGLHGPLTRLAFGPEYTSSSGLLAVLALGVWLTVLSAVSGAVVNAGGVGWSVIRLFLGILVVAVLLDLALIPAFGAYGAATATVLVGGVSWVVFFRITRRRLGVGTPPPRWALVISAAGACALMLAGSAVDRPLLQWSGLVVLPLLMVATRVISTEELRRVGRLVTQGART